MTARRESGHTKPRPSVYDDGPAYEAFMGRWSRAAGRAFLEWFNPPQAQTWLDVGCGTGAFTELVLQSCPLTAISAIDPALPQIRHARRSAAGPHVDFSVADAQALPFADGAFDVVTSALVINFVPEPLRALQEMHRVIRRGGAVGAYVWDFDAERSPTSALTRALRRLGIEPGGAPGAQHTSLQALTRAFERAGASEIAIECLEVEVAFCDLDAYWSSQLPPFHPHVQAIAQMSCGQRAELKLLLRDFLNSSPDGKVIASARANAIKARKP